MNNDDLSLFIDKLLMILEENFKQKTDSIEYLTLFENIVFLKKQKEDILEKLKMDDAKICLLNEIKFFNHIYDKQTPSFYFDIGEIIIESLKDLSKVHWFFVILLELWKIAKIIYKRNSEIVSDPSIG